MGVVLNDYFDFAQKLKSLSGSLKTDFIKEVLNRTANEVMKGAAKNTPVQDGALRRNWGVKAAKYNGGVWQATVYNSLNYALYVEEGHPTSRQGVARWVPGVWQGKKFVYIKGYKDGGMLVKPQNIEGVHMLRDAQESVAVGLDRYLETEFNRYLSNAMR